MKNRLKYIGLALLIGLLLVNPLIGQEDREKDAQSGFQFLSVVADARASGLANAVTALDMGSSSLFFNPAGMANMEGFLSMSASDNQWIADIHHNTFSMAVRPQHGKFGVFGASIHAVDYGEVQGTIVWNNEQGFLDTEVIQPTAYAIGLGYAKALSDKFSVGGQVKICRQELGSSVIVTSDSTVSKVTNELSPLAFDFGTLFKTGYKSLAFGMSVRNFSSEIEFQEEGFQLPLVFTLGISANLLDFITLPGPDQALWMTIDASHYRSHAEQVKVGLDYRFMNLLSLRGGYIGNNDENGLTFGFGVQQFGVSLDYSYTPFGVFDNVKRLTARFAL